MGYEVSTPAFEGPFDLLLHLITKQEVDIYEVSLSSIVDAYLTELDRMIQVDLDITTEFLLIAATLVELKARRLLPGVASDELDEELARFELRDLLLANLLACKTFKDAAGAFVTLMRAAERSVPRTTGPEEPFASLAPDPLGGVSLAQLRSAAQRSLTPKAQPRIDLNHVAPIRVSVRDAIGAVLAAVPRSGMTNFRQLTHGVHERLELVVRFLAVLELYKRGVIDLEQASGFGELKIRYIHEDARESLDLSGLEEWGEGDETPFEAPQGAETDEEDGTDEQDDFDDMDDIIEVEF